MTHKKTIFLVAGARPNFMKIAPLYKALKDCAEANNSINPTIIHTGQHYDPKMSEIFFSDLGIPEPECNLGVGSGSHAEQTARIMVEFEKVIQREKPDLIVVVGDVNSTIACSLTAKKLGVPVAHVEAGLRSFDMTMPEEINRMLTDTISDMLFVTEQAGLDNLKMEGIDEGKVHFVGNVMIDTLLSNLERINDEDFQPTQIVSDFTRNNEEYGVLTLHRPSNVDNDDVLRGIIEAISEISQKLPILFPVHPRARKRIETLVRSKESSNIVLTEPIGYLDMLYAVQGAALVLTDSGGLQEETTVLAVPCITIRHNTERPCTIDLGTNYLVGTDPGRIISTAREILDGNGKTGTLPPLWDGRASERIAEVIINYLDSSP